MFENQPKKAQQPQQQKPETQPVSPPGPSALDAGLIKPKEGKEGEVVDIFEGVNTGGPTEQAAAPAPKAPAPQRGGGRRLLLILLIVVIVVLVVVGGWLVFTSLQTQPIPVPTAQPTVPTTPTTPTTPTVPTTPTTPTQPTQPAPVVEIDSDGDGLSDTVENNLGTSSNNADSDGDGLFDREEVEVYLTDPLNPDTDGDSFPDGTEVQNGYNPNGAGTLLEAGFQS